MKLEIGKIYQHSATSIATKFKIEAQWSSQLFEGRALNSFGHPFGNAYLFNAAGEALGWRGNTQNATLGWRLRDTKDSYEFRMIYDGLVDNSWRTLTKSDPRYVYPGAKFLVRKRGDHGTTDLIDSDGIRALQTDAPGR
jgi:hypothetical protein